MVSQNDDFAPYCVYVYVPLCVHVCRCVCVCVRVLVRIILYVYAVRIYRDKTDMPSRTGPDWREVRTSTGISSPRSWMTLCLQYYIPMYIIRNGRYGFVESSRATNYIDVFCSRFRILRLTL